MKKLMRAHKRFAASVSGMAATEFALLLPVMVTLFFGMLEASDAMTVNRRTANASNALVDLVGQTTQLSPTELNDIFTGVRRILEPNDTSTLAIRFTSVIRDPDDDSQVIVHWSRDDKGNIPYGTGDPFTLLDDDTVLKPNMSILFVELDYTYRSGISSRVIGSPVTFKKTALRLPRRSSRVLYCTGSSNDDPGCDNT
ncbi:MAG: TadE/TadG family type IV pilus assembly protein [Pseudomonadota bacterium]